MLEILRKEKYICILKQMEGLGWVFSFTPFLQHFNHEDVNLVTTNSYLNDSLTNPVCLSDILWFATAHIENMNLKLIQ